MQRVSPGAVTDPTLCYSPAELTTCRRLLSMTPKIEQTLSPELFRSMIANVHHLHLLFRTTNITLEYILALTPTDRTLILTHATAIASLAYYDDFDLDQFLMTPREKRLQIVTDLDNTMGLLELNIPFALILSADLHTVAPKIFEIAANPTLNTIPLANRLIIYQHSPAALKLLKYTTMEQLLNLPYDELAPTLTHYMIILLHLHAGKTLKASHELLLLTKHPRYHQTLCYAYKTAAWEIIGEAPPTFDIPASKKDL